MRLQKHIFISLFLVMKFCAFSQNNDEDFFSLEREMRSVKTITQKGRQRSKIVSFFDENGFLSRRIHYHRNKMKVDDRYEYFISDTLLEVKYHSRRTLNINPEEECSIYKYYYNSLKQCYRVEIYSSKDLENPAIVATNFIYQDNQLQSYERHRRFSLIVGDFDKYIYVYSDNQRTVLIHYYEDSTLVYDGGGSKFVSIYENGKLTDFIRNAPEGERVVSGETCWDETGNKVHIRYSNFDKHGNWRKSYFMTQNGRVFRSRRKIEYR